MPVLPLNLWAAAIAEVGAAQLPDVATVTTLGQTRARVARMRRVIGVLVLLVVGFGAVWCVDGCADPMTRPNAPLQSSGGSTCVVCVVPFTTTTHFSLPEQAAVMQAASDPLVAHRWVAPTFSIDHPPRSL